MTMFRVVVLASGSSGNVTLLSDGCTHWLVDIGISYRRLKERLTEIGLEPESIQGILLTHEHGDHCRGLEQFCKRHAAAVYSNASTAQVLRHSGKLSGARWKIFSNSVPFEMGNFQVTPFPVPHDAVDPVGLRIEQGGAVLGVLTDLGFASAALFERLAGVHTLLIESNYDPALLEADVKRPWSLKQRIVSKHGHLSNLDAAAVVAGLAGDTLTRIVLCHLSGECNSPDLASRTVSEFLQERRLRCPEIHIAAGGGLIDLAMPGLPLKQASLML